MTRLSAIALVVLTTACGRDIPSATDVVPTTREGRWEQDLDVLSRQLAELHADAFARIPRERFDAEVAAVRGAIPSLDDDAIVVEMMRLIALIGDSHTSRCR